MLLHCDTDTYLILSLIDETKLSMNDIKFVFDQLEQGQVIFSIKGKSVHWLLRYSTFNIFQLFFVEGHLYFNLSQLLNCPAILFQDEIWIFCKEINISNKYSKN